MKFKISILLLLGTAVGCNAGLEEITDSLASATPSGSYSCGDYSMYDNLNDCNTTTFANCTSSWVTFPSGGAALCYEPVDGWEACALNPGQWIYSLGTYYDTGTLDALTNRIVVQYFSVVGCSSSVCVCSGTPITVSICGHGTDPGCPSPTPTPVPTATPVTTPSPQPYFNGVDCTQYNNSNFNQPVSYTVGPNNECTCQTSWNVTDLNWPLACTCNLVQAQCPGGQTVDNSDTVCKCQ